MSLAKVKELREQRAKLWEQAKAINTEYEGRALPTEKQVEWDRLNSEMAEKRSIIERMELVHAQETEQRQHHDVLRDKGLNPEELKEQLRNKKSAYNQSFRSFLRAKTERDVKEDDVKQLRSLYPYMEEAQYRGTDTQITTTNSLGGYLVPEEFSNELEIYRKMFGGARDLARVISTATGGNMPFPSVDDTANEGEIKGQGVAVAVKDLTLGSRSLGAYTYNGGMIKVAWEMLQDGFTNIESIIAELSGERIGRKENADFTNGDGTGKPWGFMVESSAGVTGAASGITRANIVDLIHSVDPYYRKSPFCKLTFNDLTLAALKKVTIGSGDARPLWQPGIRVGEPDRLEGFAYVINQDMDDIGAGNKPMAFGDFSKYVIRDVKGFSIAVTRDRYIEEMVNGYMAYSRSDGRLMNTAAIKHMVLA